MTFFQSWQLWEKMTFVLGMAIVTVICIGFAARLYNKWRLRKYEALQQVSMSHRQALQHTPSAVKRREGEIPFGIRAIQSGIQVDGVWISGTNTPVPSGPNSRAPSVMLESDFNEKSTSSETNPVAHSNSRLERPQPAHRQSSQGRLSNASGDLADGPTRSLHVERPPMPGRLSTEYVPRGRPTYQPRRQSGLRYSHIDENADALDVLEGRRNGTAARTDVASGYLRRGQHYNASSNASSASSSGDEQYHAPRRNPMTTITSSGVYEPASLSRDQYLQVDRGQRDIADTLAYHRRSQGAEEGQLVPRIRLNHDVHDSNINGPIDHRHQTLDRHSVEENSDPFMTPLGTPMLGTPAFPSPMESPTRSTYDTHTGEAPTFESFVDTNPAPDSNSVSPVESEETSPVSQESVPPLQQNFANHQQSQSQVVRKVNSGFEILRPGSFSKPRNQQPGDWNRDLERGYDVVDQTRKLERPPKKLQRRRADSKESRFKEQV